MKNHSMGRPHFYLFVISLCLSACRQNPDPDPPIAADYSNGVYVVNEGNFGASNSGITYFNRVTRQPIQVPFFQINGVPLGDVFQSMTVIGDQGWCVVNNSAKIEVVNLDDFSTAMTITSIGSPRYVLEVATDKIYVSDWATNKIYVFHPGSAIADTSIATGTGPEQMVVIGNLVFVANSGGFGIDSTLTVINKSADTVITTLSVGKGPMQLLRDGKPSFQAPSGRIWLLCRGDYGDYVDLTDDIGGEIQVINPGLFVVDETFPFAQLDHPAKMAMDPSGTNVYFLNNGLFKMDVTATTLPSTPFVSRNFYGVGVDPRNGYVYASDALDFTQSGWVLRYSMGGTAIDSFRTGIIPGDFVFH